jgi:hypothetical protein
MNICRRMLPPALDCPGVFWALPEGRMFELTECGPNKWTTMPEGGGTGSGRPNAGAAATDASGKTIDNTLIFKYFLQTGRDISQREAACSRKIGNQAMIRG